MVHKFGFHFWTFETLEHCIQALASGSKFKKMECYPNQGTSDFWSSETSKHFTQQITSGLKFRNAGVCLNFYYNTGYFQDPIFGVLNPWHISPRSLGLDQNLNVWKFVLGICKISDKVKVPGTWGIPMKCKIPGTSNISKSFKISDTLFHKNGNHGRGNSQEFTVTLIQYCTS